MVHFATETQSSLHVRLFCRSSKSNYNLLFPANADDVYFPLIKYSYSLPTKINKFFKNWLKFIFWHIFKSCSLRVSIMWSVIYYALYMIIHQVSQWVFVCMLQICSYKPEACKGSCMMFFIVVLEYFSNMSKECRLDLGFIILSIWADKSIAYKVWQTEMGTTYSLLSSMNIIIKGIIVFNIYITFSVCSTTSSTSSRATTLLLKRNSRGMNAWGRQKFHLRQACRIAPL